MLRRTLLTKTLLVSLVLQVVTAHAIPQLYYTAPMVNYGFRKDGLDQFSQGIVSAFGAANITEIPDFGTASSFTDASVLFINARDQSSALSQAEKTNISNFIAAGGGVFFVGEHGSWTGWDNSFLGLFGAQFTPWNTINAALATNAAGSPFVSGTQLNLSAPGAISGGSGTPLYSLSGFTMAAMYGPSNNAIALLDTYPLSGANGSHTPFRAAVTNWLVTTGTAYDEAKALPPASNVPEGEATGLFAATMAAFFCLRRRMVAV